MHTLRRLREEFEREIVVSTHPRTRKQLEGYDLSALPGIRFVRPLGFVDYIALQKAAFCVLSDSGTLTEESALLKFPAVLFREAHERPEGMDVGTLVMSGLDPERVVDSIRVVTSQVRTHASAPVTVPDYEAHDISRRVVRIILSYTSYVRRTVWQDPAYETSSGRQ
jgi:UDP-N-acetylglucosamine 2-epimerase (non-hydrolysing)